MFLINTELHAISQRNSSRHLVSNSQHQSLQLFANFSSFARHSFSGHLLGTDPMRPISGPWNQFGAITPHPLGTTADYPLLRGQGSKTHTSKGVPVSSLRHHRRWGEFVFKNEWKWLNMTQWNSNVTESKWNDSRKCINHQTYAYYEFHIHGSKYTSSPVSTFLTAFNGFRPCLSSYLRTTNICKSVLLCMRRKPCERIKLYQGSFYYWPTLQAKHISTKRDTVRFLPCGSRGRIWIVMHSNSNVTEIIETKTNTVM